MKDLVHRMAIAFVGMWLVLGLPFGIIIGKWMTKDEYYNKGFEAGKNYTPPVMQRIDSLTIPEFTPAERRIITQFMIIIRKAAEVKE